ncbi:MAG: DUF1570 domain-containing protein [Pirellulaceae bacterium]
MRSPFLKFASVLVLWLMSVSAMWAQAPGPASIPGNLRALPKEKIHLEGDQILEGMVLDQDAGEIEFLEIILPPGRPVYAVIQTFPRQRVRRIETVSAQEKARLEDWVDDFRNRTHYRAREEAEIELSEVELEDHKFRHFTGDRFVLLSQLDEDLTRKLALRVDQVFYAFRHLLPPRLEPRSVSRILVFGSMDHYHAHLRRIGLTAENPAIFLPEQNMVLVGTDLRRFQAEVKIAETQHQRIRDRWAEIDKSLPKTLNDYAKQLRTDGASPDEVAAETAMRREAWVRDRDRQLREMSQLERQNNLATLDLLNQAFRRISHEAFHAYLENYIYPHDQYDVPVWLNEGLAQLFEHAQFENGMFRIDAPPAEPLRRLQARLSREPDFNLAEILERQQTSFLLFERLHEDHQLYDIAWGLAWYLVFERELLEDDHLDQICRPRSGEISPTGPFDQLLGQPIEEFQTQWREYILGLRV